MLTTHTQLAKVRGTDAATISQRLNALKAVSSKMCSRESVKICLTRPVLKVCLTRPVLKTLFRLGTLRPAAELLKEKFTAAYSEERRSNDHN